MSCSTSPAPTRRASGSFRTNPALGSFSPRSSGRTRGAPRRPAGRASRSSSRSRRISVLPRLTPCLRWWRTTAPDLGFAQIDAVLAVVADHGLDGLVATNTMLARPGVFARVAEEGGLSGAPLRRRSTEVVKYVARATGGRLPIIGVGGITDIESAAEKLDAGASLVQVYTGMVYRGPFFAAELARALADRQRR